MSIEIQTANFSEVIYACVSVLIILGHNTWLVARNELDEIKIEVVNSDKFPESDSAVKPERVADFRAFAGKDSTAITNYRIEENSLVAKLKREEGASLVALELFPHPIVLEAGKFGGYIASEEAETRVAPRFVKGETTEPQRESYAKFAKVLIDNDSFEKRVGQKLEIVLQTNPSEIENGGKLKVKVLFDGEAIENLRVSVGAENMNGGKYFAHARTDENGFAELEISAGGLWFVRTHLIRPHSDIANFDWESFWASVTFRV